MLNAKFPQYLADFFAFVNDCKSTQTKLTCKKKRVFLPGSVKKLRILTFRHSFSSSEVPEDREWLVGKWFFEARFQTR